MSVYGLVIVNVYMLSVDRIYDMRRFNARLRERCKSYIVLTDDVEITFIEDGPNAQCKIFDTRDHLMAVMDSFYVWDSDLCIR